MHRVKCKRSLSMKIMSVFAYQAAHPTQLKQMSISVFVCSVYSINQLIQSFIKTIQFIFFFIFCDFF